MPTAQYPTRRSVPTSVHARRRSRLVTARLRQCCAGGLTSLPVQPSAVSAQRCCAIHRRSTTALNILWYGSSLPGCRSAPFVWHAVQTTSEIVTHWPARCPPVAVFNCWRPSFRCGCVRLWNCLPHDIVASDTLSQFRLGLKTFLFRQSYPPILF